MGFTKQKNKIVYEKVLVVKSIHKSNDSLKKVWKLQIKFSEFDCLTGYSVLFLCYLTLLWQPLFSQHPGSPTYHLQNKIKFI